MNLVNLEDVNFVFYFTNKIQNIYYLIADHYGSMEYTQNKQY